MIDREEFERWIHNEFLIGNKPSNFEAWQAARRWIPVNERLPEVLKEVLIYEKYTDYPVVAYLKKDGEWKPGMDHIDTKCGYYNNIATRDVTHWQPLPPPPEESSGK